jgi:hypothetical protein
MTLAHLSISSAVNLPNSAGLNHLCANDGRDGRQRSRTGYQLQELAARKLHRIPPMNPFALAGLTPA